MISYFTVKVQVWGQRFVISVQMINGISEGITYIEQCRAGAHDHHVTCCTEANIHPSLTFIKRQHQPSVCDGPQFTLELPAAHPHPPLLHTLVFLIVAFSRRSSAVWDPFQIPCSRSYRPVPAARLLFTLFSAPPWYRGDAAVTCLFHGGDTHWLVYMAQNRTVGEF